MIDWYSTYIENHYAVENSFRGKPAQNIEIPSYEKARSGLPQPYWEGNPSAIDCYWKTWEIAFRNLKFPTEANGFCSPYIDTAFNGNLFMWDSAFILMFCRYANRIFNFQQTLDNFYAKQHIDGFICREIRQTDGTDCFQRFDPPATGPEVLPWAEWEYYLNFGDKQRLRNIFPPLMAFHQWMKHYRTWQDGTYWACGWACGMDNQPRLKIHSNSGKPAADGPVEWWDHDHMAWIDATLQALFSTRILSKMAVEIGLPDEANILRSEIELLSNVIERTMWDPVDFFYYDRRSDGSLSKVKSIGAFWALLAEAVTPSTIQTFIKHLEDPLEFNRPHRVPSLSADHPDYHPEGKYWRGGVWAPTNYMVLRGLTQHGFHDLAHSIGLNHHTNVVKVFEQTGTLWENYAPEIIAKGNQSAGDFVGWSGLPSVAVLFEYVFGLRPDIPANILVWDVRLTEAHGVNKYPFSDDGQLDLYCSKRSSPSEKPNISVKANKPITLKIQWQEGQEVMHVRPSSA